MGGTHAFLCAPCVDNLVCMWNLTRIEARDVITAAAHYFPPRCIARAHHILIIRLTGLDRLLPNRYAGVRDATRSHQFQASVRAMAGYSKLHTRVNFIVFTHKNTAGNIHVWCNQERRRRMLF
jgi:hypothetical protein